jgi:ribosomal protein S18 acetylase RimI-like enzyme
MSENFVMGDSGGPETPNKPVVLDKKLITFHYGKVVIGCEALYAMPDELYAPCGFIWYRHTMLDQLEILYIFVHERCRRQGIATMMLKELMRWYPAKTPCTALANEFSAGWLKANGFKPNDSGWFWTPETPE